MSVDLNRLAAHLPPQQQESVKKAYNRQAVNSTAVFLACFFLGWCGFHRFYLRQWSKGFARLFVAILAVAAGVAGYAFNLSSTITILAVLVLVLIALVWEIIDLFRIDDEVHERNLKLAEELIAGAQLGDKTVEAQAVAKLDSLVYATLDQSAAAAQTEHAQAGAVAAAAIAPSLATLPKQAKEESPAVERTDAVEASASADYVATTVTEISAEPQSTQPEQQAVADEQPHSWSTTESVMLDGTSDALATEADTAEGVTEHAAADASAAEMYTQSVTRAHDESAYGVTDSVETMRTVAAAATQEEAVREVESAGALPSWTQATAPTWPDHPLVRFDEEEADLDIGPDLTDSALVGADVKPIADIATAGAAPHKVVFAEDEAGLNVVAAEAAVPEADDGLLVLIADEGAAAEEALAPAAEPGIAALGFGQEQLTPQPESYVPPTVPVVTVPESAATANTDEAAPFMAEAPLAFEPPAAYSALSEDETPTLVPERETPANQSRDDETLAALAGLAMASSAAAETAHATEAASEAAAEPVVASNAEPVSVDSSGAGVAETVESHSEEVAPVHHQMRRIRVVRQVKVDGQVVEETAAEEFIEADSDPEPVRLRLQEMLRQQAGGRMSFDGGNA